MTDPCPTCGRRFPNKKPKQDETPLEHHERIIAKAKASIAAALRKPMALKTAYKQPAG